ncbi:hypothetical protein [Streptomyces rishiriensis]|uniref:hypothetical protein n=1 Tax=Streptomyces rishiriensis TaxID=68264 RepID=UPI0037D6A8FB
MFAPHPTVKTAAAGRTHVARETTGDVSAVAGAAVSSGPVLRFHLLRSGPRSSTAACR